MPSRCKLCDQEKRLRKSHIIPAFVFRYIKETSATGYMRFSEEPNKRAQDGLKVPMLCSECEAVLNKWETPFATKFFRPYQDNSFHNANYEEWFLKFACSLSWRFLVYFRMRGKIGTYTPDQILMLDEAERVWKAFLRGEIDHPGKFQQYFIPLDRLDGVPQTSNVPVNINRYLLRSIGMDLIQSNSTLMTFCKLPKMMFFGCILTDDQKFTGGKINRNRGRMREMRYTLPLGYLNYFHEKARLASHVESSLSERQHAQIQKIILENPERAARSKTIEAFGYDREIFGDAVFKNRQT